MRVACFLLAVALLPGCTDSPTNAPAPTDGGMQQAVSPLASFSMNDCHGIFFAAFMPSQNQPSPPMGWSPNEIPVTQVSVDVHTCERVSMGNLERGPVSILLETHTNRETPDKCRPEYANNADAVSRVLTDDSAVAEELERLGLPVMNATFSWSLDGRPFYQVRIEVDGQISYLRDLGPAEGNTVGITTERFAWQNPRGGISVLDLQDEVQYDGRRSNTVIGEFASPMLGARLGHPISIGQGGVYFKGQLEGAMTHYGDSQCVEPL